MNILSIYFPTNLQEVYLYIHPFEFSHRWLSIYRQKIHDINFATQLYNFFHIQYDKKFLASDEKPIEALAEKYIKSSANCESLYNSNFIRFKVKNVYFTGYEKAGKAHDVGFITAVF
jgi:hypothetical protein